MRVSKFNESTVVLAKRVPESKLIEISAKFDAILKTYEVGQGSTEPEKSKPVNTTATTKVKKESVVKDVQPVNLDSPDTSMNRSAKPIVLHSLPYTTLHKQYGSKGSIRTDADKKTFYTKRVFNNLPEILQHSSLKAAIDYADKHFQ